MGDQEKKIPTLASARRVLVIGEDGTEVSKENRLPVDAEVVLEGIVEEGTDLE